jgi:uncharacterized OB-fold protein
MTFLERTTDPRALRHWPGNIEADYVYTSGVAAERFFRELRDHGRILGTRCPKCGTQWLPPKLFCERCFVETKDWVEAPPEGRVIAVCVVRVDLDGNPLPKPETWGLIRFEGFEGGFVHRLLVEPGRARSGLVVRPILKPEGSRAAAITDIEGFAPAGP